MEEEAKLPPTRFPVIISKPGDESELSLDGIEKLLGLSVTREVTKTTITESLDGEDGMEAQIISLSFEEARLLEERTLNEHDHHVWYPDRRTGKPMVRQAMLLKRPLDRWAASLEWEESLERGDDAGDASSSSG